MQIVEKLSPGLRRTWDIRNVVFHKQSEYQEIIIGSTYQGVTLFCDGERQSTELTQQLYHEGQIVPALLLAPNRGVALIIGSSEGVVPEMCVAESFADVIHVDIDQIVVEACARYLPYGYGWTDKRPQSRGDGLKISSPIQLIYADGLEFLRNDVDYSFDLISMDLPDANPFAIEPQNILYSTQTLSLIQQRLTPEGVFITQAGNSSLWRNQSLIDLWRNMHAVFEKVTYFELEEQDWVWLMGSNDVGLGAQEAMCDALNDLNVKPTHIDVDVIRKATIPCKTLRS